MVNFRYHIVSLVAVFLALAIGVVMGSTVIDRVTVETLEAQQRRLDENLGDARAENRRLSGEFDDLRQESAKVAREAGDRLVTGALRDVPVLLVGIRGNEASGRKELIEGLAQANARLQATMWLTERFALSDPDAHEALGELLGVEEKSSAKLRRVALERLGAALRALALGEVTPDAGLPTALSDADFLDVETQSDTFGSGIEPGTRIVLLVAPGEEGSKEEGRDASDDALSAVDRAAVDVVTTLTGSIVGGDGVPSDLVVAEAAGADRPDGSERPERARIVESLRADKVLAGRFSTVDNLDEPVGRSACLLALVDLGVDSAGHYGSGPGASRLLPAPAPAAPVLPAPPGA